ncbi:hypothetical protein BCR34DRAFT_593369 [Clohesyomyces aquaticus]|uniref:Uncharacterized protein n=1 Tax=Clohesyomyces aquaticus TaxID=1231657 RepID=A0A1Y1YIN4_9PLEO|nr:hypothetical protein BCR34DRAFT_593369 [Clohesyomyces aquaticus]
MAAHGAPFSTLVHLATGALGCITFISRANSGLIGGTGGQGSGAPESVYLEVVATSCTPGGHTHRHWPTRCRGTEARQCELLYGPERKGSQRILDAGRLFHSNPADSRWRKTEDSDLHSNHARLPGEAPGRRIETARFAHGIVCSGGSGQPARQRPDGTGILALAEGFRPMPMVTADSRNPERAASAHQTGHVAGCNWPASDSLATPRLLEHAAAAQWFFLPFLQFDKTSQALHRAEKAGQDIPRRG